MRGLESGMLAEHATVEMGQWVRASEEILIQLPLLQFCVSDANKSEQRDQGFGKEKTSQELL